MADHARRARQALPGSALEVFEGVGHDPALVTGFLHDTEPGTEASGAA